MEDQIHWKRWFNIINVAILNLTKRYPYLLCVAVGTLYAEEKIKRDRRKKDRWQQRGIFSHPRCFHRSCVQLMRLELCTALKVSSSDRPRHKEVTLQPEAVRFCSPQNAADSLSSPAKMIHVKRRKHTPRHAVRDVSASAALLFFSRCYNLYKTIFQTPQNMTAINKTVLIIPTPIQDPFHIYQAFNINID